MVRQSYRPLVLPDEQQARRHGRARVKDLGVDGYEERLGINRRPASAGRTRLFGDFASNEDEKLRASRRSVSNGRDGIPRQPPKRVTATISNRRATSSGRPGMYERGLEHKAKREAKIDLIRKEMMEECTFTPKTLYSFSSASRTSTTNASSETKGILDDVYERLYRHGSSAGTPLKARSGMRSSPMHSGASRGGSACSSRIEELYQDGKRKLRRRLTEAQERALREKRREQQEILECTFRPKTRWKTRADPPKDDLGRIGISPRSPPKTRKSHTCPPQEILVASPSDIRHWTPQRNRTNTTDYTMVSPLHDPTVYEDTRSIDDSTLLPRMHCIGSTVGTSTAASVSQVTQTDATEYGSI